MTDLYRDIVVFRETKSGKKKAIVIGWAKKTEDGKEYFSLDVLPLPDRDGRVSGIISERREKSTDTLPADREDGIPF